ncbi:MAG: HK97 gp10 family phage protein [Oscillospiraceae bacterium]|nr:HK97 gp10 family phage protein [Oscillospiraceae bacterium]
MASWGKCDYKGLVKFQQQLAQLDKASCDAFCEAAVKELAARLLSLVIPATPVGKYDQVKKSGKKGGTLRRGWGKAKDITVTKVGNAYQVEIINPVDYASYVEYGHRTANGGWVPGRFMLTISEHQLRQMTLGILEKKLEKWLRGVFRG